MAHLPDKSNARGLRYALCAVALAFAGIGPAAADLGLAKKSNCLACHDVDKKIVGPAWRAVAARYRGDDSARALLADKIKKGGKGNWTDITGGVPMPPYSPRVSDQDIERLVEFILNL